MYSTLYTCADTKPGMDVLKEKIKELITAADIEEVCKITSSVVKQAVGQLKARKSDVSGGYTSDALLNAPEIIHEHLAAIFRSWLIHAILLLWG